MKFAVTVGFMVDGSFSLGCTIQRQSGLGYFLYLMSQDVSSLSGKPCIKHGTGRKRLHQHHSYAQLLVRLWSSNPERVLLRQVQDLSGRNLRALSAVRRRSGGIGGPQDG